MSELKSIIEQAGISMNKAVEHLDEQLGRVRAGKASTKLLDGIMVEYYGSLVPLNQVGTVNTQDAKSIVITPWEKSLITEIERAIINSPLGITPENNGELREVARYTVDGRKISVPQRGLNIVKLSDGSTIKILIK